MSANPIGRAGLPGEMAAAVVWLAADDAGFVTGAVLRVDGGATAGTAELPLHYTEHHRAAEARATEGEQIWSVRRSSAPAPSAAPSATTWPAPGTPVTVVDADPEHVRRIGADGIVLVRGAERGTARVTQAATPDPDGPPLRLDRVLLAVKAQATGPALDWIAPAAGRRRVRGVAAERSERGADRGPDRRGTARSARS